MSDNQSKTAGYQKWRHLLFAHWRIDSSILQAALPQQLTIETYDGDGWLGLVPFSMENVRPWWSPSIPGISWFLETNVRTYVRHDNGQSGVWFFTLEANHRLAVSLAKRFWHLNYRFSQLSLTADKDQMRYLGLHHGQLKTKYRIDADIASTKPTATAEADTLEEFLLERYVLFARRCDGQFFTGRVHHEPYTYAPVQSAAVQQNLTKVAGCFIAVDQRPDHMAYSPGVDVRVSPLQPLRT